MANLQMLMFRLESVKSFGPVEVNVGGMRQVVLQVPYHVDVCGMWWLPLLRD
jgi:hypothetical protein